MYNEEYDKYYFSPVDDGDYYCVSNYTGESTTPVVPSTYQGKPVIILSDNLFKGRADITDVTLPDMLTDIGGFVFDGCFSLRKITLPESVENMWQYAFARSGIEEIEIPKKMRIIVPFTFFRCPNLKRVIVHSGVNTIYGNAFKDCPNLREVVIPRSCDVHETAFDGCPKVPFVYI